MDPDRHPDRRLSRPGEKIATSGRHPAWTGDRAPLDEAWLRGGGRVAGRYLRGPTRDLLQDESRVVEVVAASPRPEHGSHIAARLARDGERAVLTELLLLAPATRELPPELAAAAARRPALRRRAQLVSEIRAFFVERGFLEVETPVRVLNPGLEPHLRPFAAGTEAGEPRFLITSPELHLKQLLAAGYERVFELARAFRDDERGPLHASEFTLLEWYRTHAGLDDLAADLGALIARLAVAAGVTHARGADLLLPPRRATYASLFRAACGVPPWGLDPDRRDYRFVAEVEPTLGRDGPLLITEFPADGAALARLVPPADPADGWPLVAARMELYIAGVELANGFDELNDPEEQRRRHEADRAARAAAGVSVPPLDERFLAALEAGMPPAAGMALGVDRLLMLLVGCGSIADIRAFG